MQKNQQEDSSSTLTQLPEWAKKAVWYQIFPERFFNGDPSNDPTVETIKNGYPHDHTSPWQVHPWTSDWYKPQPYETKNSGDIWHNINRRRYGGDLQGIIDKLDYLQELGVNALYLNPVFESPSHHKYDGSTYHHVDPNFGPDPDGDRALMAKETPEDPATWQWTSADKLLLTLISEVHKRDMRIIIDGVFNHVGLNFWAFQDVVAHQQDSKFADWFDIQKFGEKGDLWDLDVTTWEGYNELPEWREDEHGIVEGPRQYIFDIIRRWMDPEGTGDLSKGVDGWRLDVAFHVKQAFWREWRKLVRSINPDAFIVGEIFGELDFLKQYLEGDQFDAVMNYHFSFATSEFYINVENRITASEFDKSLKRIQEKLGTETSYGLQNLLGSHDTDRISSRIKNRDRFDFRSWRAYHRNTKGDNLDYDITKPGAYEYTVQKLLVLFQMTYQGAPMIYYGDETGMWGANDPCCRKPMIWPEFTYEDERATRDGSERAAVDSVCFNDELFQHYKRLVAIRNAHECLQIGATENVLTDDEKQLFGFRRYTTGQQIVVILNNGEYPVEASVDPPDTVGRYRDLLTENEYEFHYGEKQTVLSLPEKWGVILLKTK